MVAASIVYDVVFPWSKKGKMFENGSMWKKGVSKLVA